MGPVMAYVCMHKIHLKLLHISTYFSLTEKKKKLKYSQIPAFVSCIVISQMFHPFKQMILAYIFSMITEKR